MNHQYQIPFKSHGCILKTKLFLKEATLKKSNIQNINIYR